MLAIARFGPEVVIIIIIPSRSVSIARAGGHCVPGACFPLLRPGTTGRPMNAGTARVKQMFHEFHVQVRH